MLYIRLVHEKEIAMHMPGLDSLECVLIDDLARMMMFLNSISSSLLVLDVAWCSLWTTYVYTVYVRIRQRNRHVDHATTCSEHTFWACSILAFSSTSSRIPHRLYDVEVRNFVHADGKKRKKKGGTTLLRISWECNDLTVLCCSQRTTSSHQTRQKVRERRKYSIAITFRMLFHVTETKLSDTIIPATRLSINSTHTRTRIYESMP